MHHVYTPTAYCGRMTIERRETNMVHYECDRCGVSATCVVTPSAELAWLDHMASHGSWATYKAWTWTVQPLPL